MDFASRFRFDAAALPLLSPRHLGRAAAELLDVWHSAVLLMAWNLLPLPHVGINPISSLLTGALGISGLPLTVFLNMMP